MGTMNVFAFLLFVLGILLGMSLGALYILWLMGKTK